MYGTLVSDLSGTVILFGHFQTGINPLWIKKASSNQAAKLAPVGSGDCQWQALATNTHHLLCRGESVAFHVTMELDDTTTVSIFYVLISYYWIGKLSYHAVFFCSLRLFMSLFSECAK
jgi:hypothetical protein